MPVCNGTTAKGEPCRSPAAAGEALCVAHLGRAHRPVSLNDELAAAFVAVLSKGNYLSVALRAVGLGETTFRTWMRRGADEAETDERFARFREDVEQARARGEVHNVATIVSAADDDWKAAAWLLERQHPDRWGKASVHTRASSTPAAPAPAAPPAVEFDDPFAEVDELSARRVRGSA